MWKYLFVCFKEFEKDLSFKKEEAGFLYDNAKTHNINKALFVKTRDSRITSISPQYSPDLSPPDFLLFSEIKSTLKGSIFENMECIKRK
jgi:hypothetical protein